MPNIYSEIYSTINNFEQVTNNNLEKYAFSESDATVKLYDRLNSFVNSKEFKDLKNKLPAGADVEDKEAKKIKNYYAYQLRDLWSKIMAKDDMTQLRELVKNDDPNTEKVVKNFITFIEPAAPKLEEEPKVASKKVASKKVAAPKVAAKQPPVQPPVQPQGPAPQIEPENINKPPENKIENKPEIINEQQKIINEHPQEIINEHPQEIINEQPEIKEEEEEILPPANIKFEASQMFEASQIKLHLNKTMINEINEMESSLPAYKNFTESLRTLKEKTDKYYTPGKDGDFPKLTKDKLEELLVFYNAAATYANNVLKVESEDTNEKRLQEIAGTVKPLLEADLNALKTASKLNEDMSLPELIYKGRSVAVHTSNAGKQMSDRMILNMGKVYDPKTGETTTRQGYFTKEKPLDLKKDFEELCDKLEKKYSKVKKNKESFMNLINRIRKAPLERKEKFIKEKKCYYRLNPAKNDPILEAETDEHRGYSMFVTASWLPLCPNDEDQKAIIPDLEGIAQTKYSWDFQDDVRNGLWSIARKHIMVSDANSNTNSLKLKEGSHIASRNAAMYDMAKLFGIQDVVAKAESVTLMQNDQEIPGVLMQEVKGLDCYKCKANEVENYTDETFNTPELKKKVADLQALDWICGNTDRNMGNFILQFDNPEQPDAKCIRVVGIDNDNSFPPIPRYLRSTHLAEPKNMVVVSRSFYDRMKNITKAQFQTVLEGHNLSKDEIAAAWVRRNDLMEQIEKSQNKPDLEKGKLYEKEIMVFEDDDWKNYSMNELGKLQSASYGNSNAGNSNDPNPTPGLFRRMYDLGNRLKKEYSVNNEVAKQAAQKRKEILNSLRGRGTPSLDDPEPQPIAGSLAGTALSYKKDPDTLRLVLPDLTDVPQIKDEISHKYPISFKENNETVEGFFTMQKVASINAVVDDVMDKAEEKYPKYKAVWKKLRERLRSDTGTVEAAQSVLADAEKIDLKKLGIDDNKLENDDVFNQQAFREVKDALGTRLRTLCNYYENGAQQNERTDLGNVTMSEVADAINKPKLLAKSRKVQVLYNGEITEGLFTEKAIGEDIHNIEDGGGLRALTLDNSEKAFNNPAGLKSLADLQVIDYICNNTARTADKIFYQFDTTDPNNPKLSGVQGIDNDMSFSTGETNSDLTNVTVVTEEMAKELRDDSLKAKIKQRLKKSALSEQAKEAVLARIETLKQKLDKEITVVPDTEWGDKEKEYTFQKLRGAKGIFAQADTARHTAVVSNDIHEQEKQRAKQNANEQAKQNANEQAKQNANEQAEQNAEQKPQIEFASTFRVESFGMNAAEKEEYKELRKEAEKKFAQKMNEIISRPAPQNPQPQVQPQVQPQAINWDNISDHRTYLNKLKKVCYDIKKDLSSADPWYRRSSNEFKIVKLYMYWTIDCVNQISKRLKNQAQDNHVMTEEDISELNQNLCRLGDAAKAYTQKRNFPEEASPLSMQKFRACNKLLNDLLVAPRRSLENLDYNVRIKTQTDAADLLKNSLLITKEYSEKEKNRNNLLKFTAQQIYLKSVYKSDFYSVKSKDQLKQALSPDNRREGIKLIMNDPAFKSIVLSKSDDDLKKLCANPDNLFEDFIKNKVKLDDLKNENAANRREEVINNRNREKAAKQNGEIVAEQNGLHGMKPH